MVTDWPFTVALAVATSAVVAGVGVGAGAVVAVAVGAGAVVAVGVVPLPVVVLPQAVISKPASSSVTTRVAIERFPGIVSLLSLTETVSLSIAIYHCRNIRWQVTRFSEHSSR
jgi:hypothetical protein